MWVLKHQIFKTHAWQMNDCTTYEDYAQKRYDGPWIIDICDDGSDDDVSDDENDHERGRKVDWDSGEDNIIEISNNDEDKFGGKFDKSRRLPCACGIRQKPQITRRRGLPCVAHGEASTVNTRGGKGLFAVCHLSDTRQTRFAVCLTLAHGEQFY